MSEAPTAVRLARDELTAKLAELGQEFQVPGAAVGILIDGEELVAVHGITNTDSPIAVDDSTLFQFGSTGKTFTASAIMVLVQQGKIDLDAPVRTYIPELKLKDEETAQKVTVLQ